MIIRKVKEYEDLVVWEIVGIKMRNKYDKFIIEILENDGIYLEIEVNGEYEEVDELMVGIGIKDGINWIKENKRKIKDICREFVNDESNWYNRYRRRCK